MPHTIPRESTLRPMAWHSAREASCRGAAVVVDNGCKPRLGGSTVRTDPQNIERRMAGSPDCIGPNCLSPMDQLECSAVGLRAFMSEGEEVSGQLADDAIHHSTSEVAWAVRNGIHAAAATSRNERHQSNASFLASSVSPASWSMLEGSAKERANFFAR